MHFLSLVINGIGGNFLDGADSLILVVATMHCTYLKKNVKLLLCSTKNFAETESPFLFLAVFLDQGLIGLTSWAVLHSWVPCSLLFFSLYLLSVGQGGYNSSLQAFGAHQLHIEHDMGSGTVKEKDRVKCLFFQWWYFGICSVSLVGNSVMSYIQDTVGWGFGFAITLVGDSDSPFLVVS